MKSLDRYYAACCQTNFPCISDRSELANRVSKCLEFIERAVVGYEPFFDVKLVVFPEFVHAAPIYGTVEELTDKLAVTVPNEFTDEYAKAAKKHGVYIVAGTFLEVDPAHPGHVFNTSCRQIQRSFSRLRKRRLARLALPFATIGSFRKCCEGWQRMGPRYWCVCRPIWNHGERRRRWTGGHYSTGLGRLRICAMLWRAIKGHR